MPQPAPVQLQVLMPRGTVTSMGSAASGNKAFGATQPKPTPGHSLAGLPTTQGHFQCALCCSCSSERTWPGSNAAKKCTPHIYSTCTVTTLISFPIQ